MTRANYLLGGALATLLAGCGYQPYVDPAWQPHGVASADLIACREQYQQDNTSPGADATAMLFGQFAATLAAPPHEDAQPAIERCLRGKGYRL